MAIGDIGKRVREARLALRPGVMRQSDLARALAISRSRLNHWEMGQHDPPVDMIDEIAKTLGVSVEWLLGEPKIMRPNPVMAVHESLSGPLYPVATPEAPIPLWPWVPGGPWCKPDDSIDFYELPNFLVKKNSICTIIKGHSMSPRLLDGDLLVFQLDDVPRYNRIALVRNGDGEATVKVLKRSEDGIPKLEPISKSHPCVEGAVLNFVGYLIAVLRDWNRQAGHIEWDETGIRP